MAKLSEIIGLRVPESLKDMYDSMKPEFKRRANEQARIAIAKVIHESHFNPAVYFGEDE